MAQQVKFYSTSAADYAAQVSAETVNGGGVYFVDGGELYKGTQRFGLGRVTVDAEFNPSTSTKAGQARGDIVVTGTGAGWVFDGEHWQSVGGDIGTITSAWKADISTWTAGLAVGDANSYITSISQAADGKVTAHASPFPDIKATIGDGFASASANGITVSVTTTSGSVTQVELDAANLSVTSITANAGTFTELTVDTATFTATSVAASTLTIGGKTVEQIAGEQIEASTLTGYITDFDGTDLVNEGQVVTYVSAALSTFDNAMHFRSVVTSTGAISDPASGDIVVIGANPAEGFSEGQEYIYDGTKWEKIGDQSAVTGGTSTSTLNNVSVQVVTAAATAAPTVTLTGVGTAASKNFADTLVSTGTSLPTESAVAGYVTGVIEGLDASVSSNDNAGIQVGVTQADGVVTGVTADLVWLGADGTALS